MIKMTMPGRHWHLLLGMLQLVFLLSMADRAHSHRKLVESPSCAPVWAQCGGKGFKGPTCCQLGSRCKATSEFYSQCVHLNDNQGKCSPWWGQCGGNKWPGPFCCEVGSSCKDQINNGVKNEFYSQCIPGNSDGGPPHGACSPLWGQCGGRTWTGPFCCQEGSVCKEQILNGKRNEFYSQCLPGVSEPCTVDEDGPTIRGFTPTSGPPGTLITIFGTNLSPVRLSNTVLVGGIPALVVSSSSTELKVITETAILDGAIAVTVAGRTATAPTKFTVLGFPNAGAGDDGPPMFFEGGGTGDPGDLNPIGTIKVLVALVRPSDRTPAANERQQVIDTWNAVRTYYDQVSYGRTKIVVDVTTNWAVLDGTIADFIKDSNIDPSKLDRMTAIAAKGAVDQGLKLNDYAMMATVCSLNVFIRAWGGWSRSRFQYTNAKATPPINIDLSVDHAIFQAAISQDSNWGRCAHELGHNLVSAPSFPAEVSATLGEDVYSSDLVNPNDASAERFEMMGQHDLHPLFSGYHMENLKYYNDVNILTLQWDRNSFSQEYEIIAHGLTEDTSSRFHLVKVRVTSGLSYYIEVRQLPDASAATRQVFDENIPVGTAGKTGGVIVTRVIADTLNINQQTRFITLLHENRVLLKDDEAVDPARGLKITVLSDAVQARPLVCKVRVAWAEKIDDDPKGQFDIRVEPWDSNWQTPDIWVDRKPYNVFDQPKDAENRPLGNGDKPRPNELNYFNGRVHVSGAVGASNVKVTFYSVFPPGVGDNGNWAPLGTHTIASIASNSFADQQQEWVPLLGQHTCLKIYASAQLGEVTGGNNMAQENVFDFEAPASSPPAPVMIRVAVRNPKSERSLILLSVLGVPARWRVHFPHSWVWLEAKAEKQFDLTVVPLFDWYDVVGCPTGPSSVSRTSPVILDTAKVNLEGRVPREYTDSLAPFQQPAGSRFLSIGGILGRVHARKKTFILIEEGLLPNATTARNRNTTIIIRGAIGERLASQRVEVLCTDPAGRDHILFVNTTEAGIFQAVLDLKTGTGILDSSTAFRQIRGQTVLRGTYHCRASLFDASLVAEADSNDLNIFKYGNDADEEEPDIPIIR